MANAFFSDLLATISERGRTLLRRDSADTKQDADGLIELCGALLSGRGEASGTAMAREVLDVYQELDAAGRRAFFDGAGARFRPGPGTAGTGDRDMARQVRPTRTRARCISPRSRGGRS